MILKSQKCTHFCQYYILGSCTTASRANYFHRSIHLHLILFYRLFTLLSFTQNVYKVYFILYVNLSLLLCKILYLITLKIQLRLFYQQQNNK